MQKGRYLIKKYQGVYGYDSTSRRFESKPDVCYWFTYKIYEDEKWKKKWEKVGWKSEGYSSQLASEIRTKRVRNARHGKSVKTAKEIRAEKCLHDRPLSEIKDSYFSSEKGPDPKSRKTDLKLRCGQNAFSNLFGEI